MVTKTELDAVKAELAQHEKILLEERQGVVNIESDDYKRMQELRKQAILGEAELAVQSEQEQAQSAESEKIINSYVKVMNEEADKAGLNVIQSKKARTTLGEIIDSKDFVATADEAEQRKQAVTIIESLMQMGEIKLPDTIDNGGIPNQDTGEGFMQFEADVYSDPNARKQINEQDGLRFWTQVAKDQRQGV